MTGDFQATNHGDVKKKQLAGGESRGVAWRDVKRRAAQRALKVCLALAVVGEYERKGLQVDQVSGAREEVFLESAGDKKGSEPEASSQGSSHHSNPGATEIYAGDRSRSTGQDCRLSAAIWY